MSFEQTTSIIGLALQLLIGGGAVTFAALQWRINSRMKQLQDYVAVATRFGSVVGTDGQIEITNIGKINLYLYKYEIVGETKEFDDGNLIAVGNGIAPYGIEITNINGFEPDKLHELKLYLKDSGGKKYISKHTLMRKQVPTGNLIFMTDFAPEKFDWNY